MIVKRFLCDDLYIFVTRSDVFLENCLTVPCIKAHHGSLVDTEYRVGNISPDNYLYSEPM